MSALLEARELSKRFGGVRAVAAISLEVAPRSIFAVIGPNGAGKSTLLNLLSGVHLPDAGTLRFDGVDITALAAHQRARLGLARTFQKIRLFRQLSALENVLTGFHRQHDIPPWEYLFPGARRRADRERFRREALELLDFVGLRERAGERAGALAYGEQRMLEIARALATRPRVLMLDEPAAGLNAAEVEALFARLETLRERGMTVILIEHNMDLVMRIADRVFVMDHGEYLAEGPPAEVQRHPAVIEAYLGAEELP